MSGKYNSNTSTMNSQQVTLDSLVFDYYRYAIDAILKDRKSKMNPIISSSQLVTQVQPPASFAAQTIDHVGYISNTLQGWKKSLTKPMTLDIYLYHSQLNQHILIERWSFSYQANNDFSNKSSSTGGTSSSSSSSSNSNRLVAIVNRRIQTFVRSLYCFVRLLPGFNLLQLSRIEPFMHFQIYESRMSPSNFFYEVSKHHFPPIATTKGKLTTSLQFIDSIHVMEIIKTINGGALIGAGPALSSSPEVAKTASSPIPISGNAAPRARTHTADDPYKRSFHRPTELPLMETGPHARSYESNVPETVARMNSHPIRIPGSQRHRDSFEGDPMYSNPTGYSFGSTPPVSSYSQNTPPFAHYPMNQNDDGSSDGNSVEMAGPSPPYSQYSSSLNSTSPHGTNLALVDRRNSFRRSQISSSFGRPTSINFYDYDKLRTKITLPASPFILPHQNSASSSGTQVTTIATGTPNTAGDAIITPQQRQQQRTRSKEDSNKLDFVLQFEREKERQISGIYVDVLDRSRSISGITRDEELEKLTDLFGSNHPNQQPLSDHQNNVDDEEMPFAVPPAASNDIASSIFGYGRPVHSSSMSEANTYYSLTAVSGELMSKLNEFKEFRSNISLL